jgi:hypothetical protein
MFYIKVLQKKVLKIELRRLSSYRETHKKSNAIFNCQVGTFYKKKYVKNNLDPGKLYFINKRVKLREKIYFLKKLNYILH